MTTPVTVSGMEKLSPLPTSASIKCRTGCRGAHPGSGPLTWVNLDARVDGLVAELDGAITRDDLQDVGRRSREILIDCARLLADPSVVPAGQLSPKTGDAKAWLDLFLAARASGASRDGLRRLVRAAWDVAQTVTHGDVERVDAFAAAQATVLVVRTLQSWRGQACRRRRLLLGDPALARRLSVGRHVRGRSRLCSRRPGRCSSPPALRTAIAGAVQSAPGTDPAGPAARCGRTAGCGNSGQ